jgi:hypothetical protein
MISEKNPDFVRTSGFFVCWNPGIAQEMNHPLASPHRFYADPIQIEYKHLFK